MKKDLDFICEIIADLKRNSFIEGGKADTMLNDWKNELQETVEPKSKNKLVTVTIVTRTASGRRESWLKHVTSIDSTQKDGYAYVGDFLSEGQHEIDSGSIVIECIPCGSVKNGYKEGLIYKVQDNGELKEISERYDWKTESVSFRKEVEKYF